MRSFLFFLSILIFSFFNIYSQNNNSDINFIKDEKITWLLEQHKTIQEENTSISGYRVQIYADSGSGSRLRTQRVQSEFRNKYPDTKTYLIYEEPYFKLRAGNFRTRIDARRFLEKLSDDYSHAFIVSDNNIEFPDLE